MSSLTINGRLVALQRWRCVLKRGGGGGEGAHLSPDHKQTPPQILKNALCCSLAQAIFTVFSVPVIDLSQYTISHLFRLSADLWCFLGSP